MAPSIPNDKRRYQRARVSLFADCSAQLEQPLRAEALVEDISAGGLRIQISAKVDRDAFGMHMPVRGEILSDNPALQMPFAGKIVWRSAEQADGNPILRLGIAFDAAVVLSEMLQSLKAPQTGVGS